MITLIIIGAIVLCAAMYLISIKYFRGLPVLMYHKITEGNFTDYLTITQKQLQDHFNYLSKKGYNTIFLSELVAHLEHGKPLPQKPVLLTFDDGYKDNYLFLYPLLKKHKLKANIFLITDVIQSQDPVQQNEDSAFLHVSQIKKMLGYVEFGLHTCVHKNYNELSLPQIKTDIQGCREKLDLLSVPYQPCLAYTFGAYPKKDKRKRNAMFQIFEEEKIIAAFRIGNRLNRFPLKNKFLIQRIDVKGSDSFTKFRYSLKVGRKYSFT